jgi:hypothetical protein
VEQCLKYESIFSLEENLIKYSGLASHKIQRLCLLKV